jgi:hypothetical protein
MRPAGSTVAIDAAPYGRPEDSSPVALELLAAPAGEGAEPIRLEWPPSHRLVRVFDLPPGLKGRPVLWRWRAPEIVQEGSRELGFALYEIATSPERVAQLRERA